MTPDAASAPTSPSGADLAALRARIEDLETQNARLADDRAVPDRPQGSRVRAFVAALCIILGSIIAPVSVAGAWARAELVDPDRFVATFGPLIDDPAVQELIIDEVTTAIEGQVDLTELTDTLFDGIATLDLPPAAAKALDLLRGPAGDAAQGLIRQAVTTVVTSDAFSDVWSNALRLSHRALELTASGGNEGGAVTIDDKGAVGIQLKPIIEDVKQRLVDNGFGFAAGIPTIDRTIVLVQSDALVVTRIAYALTVSIGWWLPVIALLLLAAGVLIARRRSTALLGAGVGLALGSGVLAVGFAIGGAVAGVVALQLGLPSAAVSAVYEQVIQGMRQTAVVLTLVGVVVAILAWSQGRWRAARTVRTGTGAVTSAARSALVQRGVRTGRVGVWLDRQRVLVRVLIGALAVVWLLLVRPLTVSDVLLVLVVSLVLWWIADLLRAPAADTEEEAGVETGEDPADSAEEPDSASISR